MDHRRTLETGPARIHLARPKEEEEEPRERESEQRSRVTRHRRRASFCPRSHLDCELREFLVFRGDLCVWGAKANYQRRFYVHGTRLCVIGYHYLIGCGPTR